jgi:hypothetical protein
MCPRPQFVASLVVVALLLAACAAAPGKPDSQGLMRTPSSQLDELYLRPYGDLNGYGRVLLDPVPVALHPDGLAQRNAYNRIQPMYAPYADAESVTRDMAQLMHEDFAEALRAGGYELVSFAGPGVMRISVSVREVYVNAPERESVTRAATRDAGQAKLSLEARDSQSGALLARIEHFGLAREVGRANPADDVSNRMWFDVLFRRFAANCVAALAKAQRTGVTLSG